MTTPSTGAGGDTSPAAAHHHHTAPGSAGVAGGSSSSSGAGGGGGDPDVTVVASGQVHIQSILSQARTSAVIDSDAGVECRVPLLLAEDVSKMLSFDWSLEGGPGVGGAGGGVGGGAQPKSRRQSVNQPSARAKQPPSTASDA